MPTMVWVYVDAIDAVGKPVDFEVFDEIQTNVNGINDLVDAAIGTPMGTSTFNGATGRDVVFADEQADANYLPIAIAAEDAGGNLGEISYGNIATTGFTVYNTGSFTGNMRWKILR